MKKIYLLFLLLPLFSFSQEINQKKVDSLLVILNYKKEDTSKVILYQAICESYANYSPKKVAFYNNKLLALSKKIKFEKGIGFYYYNNIFLIDYLLAKKAIPYASKASSIFKKTKDTTYFISSQCFIADRYYMINQNNKTKSIITQTLPYAIKSKHNFEKGFMYTLLGRIDYDDGLLNNALKFYKTALNYHNKDNINEEDKFILYFNISLIYTDLKKHNQALEYLAIINKDKLSPSYNIETGRNYIKLKNFKKALEFFLINKKLKMSKEENFVNATLLAETYYNLNKNNLAIKYAKSVVNLTTNKEVKMNNYNTLSKSYLKLRDFKKAKDFNDKASVIVDKATYEDVKIDFYSTRIDLAVTTGNYKEAFLTQKKLAAFNESCYNKKNNDQINELQINFDVAEKDNNIKDLKFEKLQKTIQINKQKSYITYGIIFIVLILFGVLIFMKLYRTIKKKNSLISINNTELENAKIQLEKSVQVKETLLKEIHHRVKNNLQLVISLLYIQSKEKDTNMEDFLEISQSRIIAMALIHENLYQTEDFSKVDFKEYASSLTQSIVTSYNNLQQDIYLQIEIEAIYLDIQTAIPLGLIINELISNAYKHAFVNHKKGVITLQLVQTDNNFELIVKDNGVGMSGKIITKKSLGLELVNQLVSQINGILQIQDNLGMQYKIQFQNITL